MNNTLELRVGMMPGKLTTIIIEKGITARECFKIAEIELSNHEIRLDGEKIDLDRTINEGRLLVGMRLIKGNMKTIKVGLMPGRLQQIEVSENTTAREVFEKAGIELSNHEVRLDGEKIDLDTVIYNGNLCVGLKMIKGNAEFRKTNCTQEEVAILLGVELPQVINTDSINMCGDNFLQIEVGNETLIVEEDMFLSVYNIVGGDETVDIKEIREEVEIESKDSKAMDVLNKELEDLEKSYNFYMEEALAISNKIMFLKRIISEINA